MFFIKYSKDKEALSRILAANGERFQSLERRAADVIKAITNLELKYDEEEERVDMCQAVQDMCIESRAEGMAKGRAEGIALGATQKAQEMAKNFYSMGIEIEKIAQGVGYAVETVQQWLGL